MPVTIVITTSNQPINTFTDWGKNPIENVPSIRRKPNERATITLAMPLSKYTKSPMNLPSSFFTFTKGKNSI